MDGYYIKELYKKDFSAASFKEAYLNAAKWVATNVVHESGINSHVCYTFAKSNKNIPTIILTIYVKVPEEEIRERHCNICKEVHGTFYMGGKENCSTCKLNAYNRRVDEQIKKESKIVKEELYKKLGGVPE